MASPNFVVLCSSRHITKLYDCTSGQTVSIFAFSSQELSASYPLNAGKGTCVTHGPHLSLQEIKAIAPGEPSWSLPQQYGAQITCVRRLSKALLIVTAKGQGTVFLLDARKLANNAGFSADVRL